MNWLNGITMKPLLIHAYCHSVPTLVAIVVAITLCCSIE